MKSTHKRALGWLAAAGLAGAWLGWRYRQNVNFYYKLYQARREATRFYADCATLTKNMAPHPSVNTRLDVYQPDGAQSCPVFIYVYGGSWNSGDKELYAPMAQRLLPEGLVLVLPNYTTYPAARHPQPVKEIAAAIAWTLDNIQHFGGDPSRVVLGAQSAGAQIAALALLDPQWLAAHGHSAADIRAFVGISGVYDMVAEAAFVPRQRGYLAGVAGGAANLETASPIQHVGRHAPPTLLIHGDADTTVPMSISVAFDKRLRAVGVPSQFIRYAGGGHSGILFEAMAQNPSRLLTDIMRFVRLHTTVPQPAQAAGYQAPA